MLFYRISEQKIKTILKNQHRREEGIAPNTVAVMMRNDTPKRKEEIWVMFADASNPKLRMHPNASNKNLKKTRPYKPVASGPRMIMISTWRYPGKSKPGTEIPIPDDILSEIQKEWF